MFKEIEVSACVPAAAEKINTEWMLVTAGNPETGAATMTISWGAFGFIWGSHVANVAIRKSRNTLDYMRANGRFSIALFDRSYRDKLAWCGANSGRDFDKPAHCGFTTLYREGVPYFAEANTVLFCRTLYSGELAAENFADKQVYEKWYSNADAGNTHIGFYAAIESAIARV